MQKYLVISKKSSTFAAKLGNMRARERGHPKEKQWNIDTSIRLIRRRI